VERIRPTRRQLVIGVAAPVILLAALALVSRRGGPFYLAIGAIVGSVVVGLARARVGVDLLEDRAVVRGLVGAEAIPWVAETAIEVTQRLGHRSVVLRTAEANRRLAAPSTSAASPDPDFDAKVDRIGAHWQAAAG
jgi:hypothetical protein